MPDHLPQTRAERRRAEEIASSPSRAARRRRRAEAVRHARAGSEVRRSSALPQVVVVTLGLVGGLLAVPATQELGGEGPGLEPIGARWDAALGRDVDRASRGDAPRGPVLAEGGTAQQPTSPQTAPDAQATTPVPEPPAAASPEPVPEPAPELTAPAGPPQLGATGPEVQEIQERLQAHGATLLADGEFGAGTDRALRTFQAAQGLEPDGVAGAATRAALLADPATSTGGAGADGQAPSSGTGDMAAVLDLVNTHRAAASCPALRADDQLARAATLHAQDMVDQGYFSHTSLDGRTFGDRVTAQGYARPGGENIAAGQQTAQAVVDAWMASEGHRANILNCDFTAMGIGRVGNTWVQVFGY